ncbi:MAG: hypothetical protein GY944_04550 [bacterium]|nr:hypothetical protein [bacterium]
MRESTAAVLIVGLIAAFIIIMSITCRSCAEMEVRKVSIEFMPEDAGLVRDLLNDKTK